MSGKMGGSMLTTAEMNPQSLIFLCVNLMEFLTSTLVEVKRYHQPIQDHEERKNMLIFLNRNASEVSTQHPVFTTSACQYYV